jgi:hypothetical protein
MLKNQLLLCFRMNISSYFWDKLAWNSSFPCLSLLGAGITGMHHHAWQNWTFTFSTLLFNISTQGSIHFPLVPDWSILTCSQVRCSFKNYKYYLLFKNFLMFNRRISSFHLMILPSKKWLNSWYFKLQTLSLKHIAKQILLLLAW